MKSKPCSISGKLAAKPFRRIRIVSVLVSAAFSSYLICPSHPAIASDWDCGWGTFSRDNFPGDCWRPYSNESAINTPLPANPRLAANSAAVVANIIGTDGQGAGDGTVGALWPTTPGFGDYGKPYFFNAPTDPEYDIVCTREPGVWIGCPEGVYGQKVRIPTHAQPANGTDGHMIIIDQASGYIWDFLEVQPRSPTGGEIRAGTVGKARVDSTGHYPRDVTCANAVCIGLLAGIIRQQELASGSIDHALFAVIDCSHLSYGSDGRTFPANPDNQDPGCPNSIIPQGGWFQLNLTEAQIDALSGISGWQKTILKAMSKYGMFVGDEGSNHSFEFQVEAAPTYTGRTNPWIAWAEHERTLPNHHIVGDATDFYLDFGAGLPPSFWAANLRLIDPCVIERTCTPPPLQLVNAASAKTHGAAGTFDIFLPLTGEPGVECRSSGGTHKLVASFNNPVVSGGATVTTGTGSAGTPSFLGNTMTVNLSGVADVQRLTVTLSGVTDAASQVLPNTALRMNMLIGDTNASKVVNASDIGETKAQSGVPANATNFRADVAVSGAINATDIGLVKSRSGSNVP